METLKTKTTLILFLLISQFSFAQQENIDSLLFEAVKSNNIKQVKQLVEKGANVNWQDENEATILMWAAYKADIEIVKYLVKKGADYLKKGVIYINGEKTSYYGNLLGIAAGENKFELLKYLIENLKIDIEDVEYNPETKKDDGWNALQWAASKGHLNIVEYLLEKGADINAKTGSNGNTALIIAILSKEDQTAKLLIMNNANVNIQNNIGGTALHCSVNRFDYKIEIIKRLLEKGANPNLRTTGGREKGWTPLMFAATIGEGIELVKLLIEKGADINVTSKSGNSPLLNATKNNNTKLAIWLIEKGANINVQAENGNTPLIYATSKNNTELTNLLIEKGADVNATDKSGNSPLLNATKNNNTKLAIWLIEKGADVNAKNKEGDTPLYYSCRNSNGFKIAKLLLEKGADINEPGGAPLLTAILYNTQLAIWLIEKGADVDSIYKGGFAPIHQACELSCHKIVQLLIDNHADINVKTPSGSYYNPDYSPLFIAAKKRNPITTYLLIEGGADTTATNKEGLSIREFAKSTSSFDVYNCLKDPEQYKIIALYYIGAYKTILQLLKKDSDLIKQFDHEGQTIIHLAIKNGNEKLLK